jgi:chromosome segregation and condensation protein ScpB
MVKIAADALLAFVEENDGVSYQDVAVKFKIKTEAQADEALAALNELKAAKKVYLRDVDGASKIYSEALVKKTAKRANPFSPTA